MGFPATPVFQSLNARPESVLLYAVDQSLPGEGQYRMSSPAVML